MRHVSCATWRRRNHLRVSHLCSQLITVYHTVTVLCRMAYNTGTLRLPCLRLYPLPVPVSEVSTETRVPSCVARRLAGHPSRVAYCDNDMVLAALYARVGGMMRRDKNVWARGVNMYHEDELELAITDPDNFQHGFHPPRASLRLHRARTLCGRSDDADPPHEASSGIVMNNAFIYLAAYHVVLRLARANNH